MALVAQCVHECLRAYSTSQQDYLFEHSRNQTGITLDKAAWLDRTQVVSATDYALQAAFSAWRIAAQKDQQRLLINNELPIGGQHIVLDHLPIAPMDCGNKEFIGHLYRCAQYYLDYT